MEGAGAGATREAPRFARTEPRAACADFTPTTRPFFGDTHVHTTLSFDANIQDTLNTPRDAYRSWGSPAGWRDRDDLHQLYSSSEELRFGQESSSAVNGNRD
ncbi:DUF3604 domain-containing protein [Aurantimonas coralicida]|uniref:DUF3604 domain-containing protein n=1 Tax=Aurantimonas coralicida TaxID=182270 RepID=UPI003C6C231F